MSLSLFRALLLLFAVLAADSGVAAAVASYSFFFLSLRSCDWIVFASFFIPVLFSTRKVLLCLHLYQRNGRGWKGLHCVFYEMKFEKAVMVTSLLLRYSVGLDVNVDTDPLASTSARWEQSGLCTGTLTLLRDATLSR